MIPLAIDRSRSTIVINADVRFHKHINYSSIDKSIFIPFSEMSILVLTLSAMLLLLGHGWDLNVNPNSLVQHYDQGPRAISLDEEI